MSREQMVKAFSEVYVGQDPRKLEKEYTAKKKREIFLLIMASVLVVSLSVVSDIQNSKLENNTILRNDVGSGKEEISLQMKTQEGTWEDVHLELYPKEYSEEELERLFLDACEKLPSYIKNENESLDLVVSDLCLVQEMEGYPFLLKWENSNSQIMDEEGHILYSSEGINEVVELTAIFQYEDWEKQYSLPVHVITTETKAFRVSLEEELKKQEGQTREEEEFYLPETFEKTSLQWRYVPGNSALILGILFAIIIPLICYEKDREIYTQARKRKEQLQEDFPEFISKLILLLEAGMSIHGAIFRIVEDEKKKQEKNQRYLYTELAYICRQMKNGLPEKEAYGLLGNRCNLSCYKKLSGLLVQHLQKGGSSILDTLRKEAQKAGEEQRRQIQKKGEEMGTKLLFPMMIMLGIVMVFIMVPALFSFQL